MQVCNLMRRVSNLIKVHHQANSHTGKDETLKKKQSMTTYQGQVIGQSIC